MTVQGAPRTSAPPRVDLHVARADVERRWRRWSIVSLLPMFVASVAMAPAYLGDPSGYPLKWAVSAPLTVLAVGIAALAFDRRRNRQVGGPASPGPSSIGEVVSSAPGQVLWASVFEALAATGWTPVRLLDPHTLDATRWDRGGRSWVTVRVEGVGDGRALVTVWTHPEVSWFSGGFDYGLHQRQANALLAAIPGVDAPAHEPDASSHA